MDRHRLKDSLRHGNLAFDVMACSAIGGASLALFFFLLDIIDGRPLFTPSLCGSVLFLDAPAERFSEVSLSMVAGYTVVHFALFALIGLVGSVLAHLVDQLAERATVVLLGVVAIEVVFFSVARLWLPGVIGILGTGRILVANVIAGVGIGVYLMHFRHQIEWHAKGDEALRKRSSPA